MVFSSRRELKRFLAEDIGKGDLTSKLLIPKKTTARIITREQTVVAGISFAKQIFELKGCTARILSLIHI